MNPQTAFLDLLVAAMKDAATTGHCTQLAVQLDPGGTGKGPLKRVRVVVVPDDLTHTWPSHAPLGSAGQG